MPINPRDRTLSQCRTAQQRKIMGDHYKSDDWRQLGRATGGIWPREGYLIPVPGVGGAMCGGGTVNYGGEKRGGKQKNHHARPQRDNGCGEKSARRPPQG